MPKTYLYSLFHHTNKALSYLCNIAILINSHEVLVNLILVIFSYISLAFAQTTEKIWEKTGKTYKILLPVKLDRAYCFMAELTETM